MNSFYRTGGPLQKMSNPPSDEGRAIRLRVALYLSGDSAPHDPNAYYKPFEQCEACAILADSLRLLASLENV
jgi:hypothetical protein